MRNVKQTERAFGWALWMVSATDSSGKWNPKEACLWQPYVDTAEKGKISEIKWDRPIKVFYPPPGTRKDTGECGLLLSVDVYEPSTKVCDVRMKEAPAAVWGYIWAYGAVQVWGRVAFQERVLRAEIGKVLNIFASHPVCFSCKRLGEFVVTDASVPYVATPFCKDCLLDRPMLAECAGRLEWGAVLEALGARYGCWAVDPTS